MKEETDNFLQLTYAFSQPLSILWQAWTDPSIVKMWFGSDPNGRVLEAEFDVQVGGLFRVKFTNSDGSVFTAKGIYKEIELYKKLIFTWGWEEQPHINELVEVIFEAREDYTVMSFEHHNIDKNSAHNYAEGWKSTFIKLERALGQVRSNS